MAALGSAVNLLDLATRMNQDGNIDGAAIAELLSQTNSFNGNCVFKEGNMTTGERVTIRTGLPTIYFRKLNQGVQPSKSTTVQVDEGTCMMEARGQIDKDLADLNGLTAAFRMSENSPFIEAMGQTFGQKAFYGNTGLDPEQLTGLATRYSDDSGPANAENIISGGGSGSDNTSIWLVDHSDQGCYGIYPKGLTAGLTHEDLGLGDAFDTQTPPARFRAYMDLWQWKAGLVVKDWRRVVRAANIDVSNLIAETSAADILELMAVMVDKIPAGQGNLRFYCNRTVRTMLRIQCMNRPNVYLTLGQEEGRPKLSFDGIPIELHDSILNTESAVT